MTTQRGQPGMQNLREVSGQNVVSGGRVRRRALLRSDSPGYDDPTPAEPAWPPATVIDLRSPSECTTPHPLSRYGSEIHSIPMSKQLNMLEFDADEVLRNGGLAELYRQTIIGAEPAIVAAVDAVAKATFPVLIHCALGKDRTGILVAAILSAIDVPDDAIIADYVKTDANMTRVAARLDTPDSLVANKIRNLIATYPEGLGAPPEAIAAVLQLLRDSGGARQWLLKHGLHRNALRALLDRLVEHSEKRRRVW
jgi:protein-tyrosine phosphatase